MEQRTTRRSDATSTVDPWVPRLLIAVLVILVLVLTAVIYMVYTGVLTGQAPRTLAEKQIATLDRSFKANPGDSQVVADYMRALISVERYSKARSVMNTYRSGEATASAIVSVEEARLLDATGDTDKALEVVDRAIDEAKAEKEATIAAQAAKGVKSDFYSEAMIAGLLLKAQIAEDNDMLEDAVTALDAALEELPSMADVLAWRGGLNARLGKTAAARADYTQALTMIPDYQPALDGLSELEKGAGSE